MAVEMAGILPSKMNRWTFSHISISVPTAITINGMLDLQNTHPHSPPFARIHLLPKQYSEVTFAEVRSVANSIQTSLPSAGVSECGWAITLTPGVSACTSRTAANP